MTPPYPKYCDSGVEWLGSIPCQWRVERMGALFEQAAEPGREDLPVLSVSIHSGVSDDEIDPEGMDRKVTRSDDRTKYKTVRPGDLVYNMMRAWQGGFGTVTVEGMVSPAYVVARPRPGWAFLTTHVEALLRTAQAVEEMRRHSHGVTDFRLRLYWDEFKNIKVALPPLEEQRAIAAFLDRETGKIDALVEEQRRLIVLLKEKRQAVISHAVTKGLDPTAPLKPSGIDWLGDIPAHWTVNKFARCVKIAEGQVDPREEPYSAMMLIAPNHIESGTGRLLARESAAAQGAESGKYMFGAGAVIYSKIRPALAKVTVAPEAGLCSADMYPLTGRGGFEQQYLALIIMSPGFTAWAVLESDRVAMPKINREKLNELRLPVPPRAEQRKIIEFVREETAKLDALISEAETAIDLLQERRSALISAAVTGKIDVRALAPDATEAA